MNLDTLSCQSQKFRQTDKNQISEYNLPRQLRRDGLFSLGHDLLRLRL